MKAQRVRWVDAFQVGIALKPSALGDDEATKLRNASSLYGLSKDMGLDYFVLDSERENDDLSILSLESLAREADGTNLVITLPVRRCDARERFRGLCRLVAEYPQLELCLVAGNPAYLNGLEASLRAGMLLSSYASEALQLEDGNRELMIGSERVERTLLSLSHMENLVPFVLMDSNYAQWAETFGTLWSKIAVYVPLHVGPPSVKAYERLRSYVLRRPQFRNRNDEDLELGIRSLTLHGAPEEVRSGMERLRGVGFNVIVGWLVEPSPEQLLQLAKVL